MKKTVIIIFSLFWGLAGALKASAQATATPTSTSTPCAVNDLSWTTKTAMPTPRDRFGVGVINGIIYAVGGQNNISSFLNVVEAYDPGGDTWSTKADMPTGRFNLGVAAVNGILYAVGGQVSTGEVIDVVEAFDPTVGPGGTWSTKAPMPTARSNFSTAVVGGILYAVGGQDSSYNALNTVEAYDPVGNSWSTKATMPTARYNLSVGAVNGIIYAAGGLDNLGTVLNTLESFNPTVGVGGTWSTKASMPTSIYAASTGVMNGLFYVAGGGTSTAYVDSVEAYDPAGNSWSAKNPILAITAGNAGDVVNGVLYSLGGWDGFFLDTNQAGTYVCNPTPTISSTSTETFTPTLSPTVTLTPTFTPTGSLTPTMTFTPTATLTPTATVIPTLTPTGICCLLASPWTSPSLASSAGLAVDPTRRRVYASDGISGKILALNYDGSSATSFGGGFVSLPAVFAVAVGKGAYDGLYAVARNASVAAAVTKYDADGNVVWTVPGAWSSGTERTLCVDDWGNVYVVTDSSQIYVFDSTGSAKTIITSPGPLGPLSTPSGLLMVGLNLYVSDSGNVRIVQFVESGVNTYSYSASKAVTLSAIPYGLAADMTGHFYVSSTSIDGYASFDGNFNQLTQWCSLAGGAFEIGVDETGAIYMSSSSGLRIVKANACFPQTLPAYHGFNPPDSGECFIYPSPARGDHATLSYKMTEPGKVELKVWNERAELVSDVTDQKSAGVQVTPFTISGFSTGVYFYSLILTYDSGKVEKIKPHKFAVIH